MPEKLFFAGLSYLGWKKINLLYIIKKGDFNYEKGNQYKISFLKYFLRCNETYGGDYIDNWLKNQTEKLDLDK